jgi:hypothetical protein
MKRRFLEQPMKSRFGFVCVLLGTGFLNTPGAYSQSPAEEALDKRSQSHVTIPIEGRDFNQLLRNRFEGSRMMKNVSELLKNPRDSKLQEQLKEDLSKPQFQQLLEDELKSHREELSEEKFEEIKGLLKKTAKLTGNSGDINVDWLDELKNRRRQEMSNGPESRRAMRSMQPPPGSPQSTSPGRMGSGKAEAQKEPFVLPKGSETPMPLEQFRRQAHGSPPPPPSPPTWGERATELLKETLDANKGPLSESKAVQDALRQLRRSQFRANQAGQNDDAWANQFAHLSESLTKSEIWSKVNWPKLGKWQLPSPRSLPKLHSPWGAPSFEKMPRVSMPSASAIDRGMQLLWLAIIVAAGVVIWRLFGKSIPGMGRLGGRAWKLGPWPVAPSAVASGQDLILAFEHLSLMKLGPAAQSRNHLDLAVDLGQEEVANRRAAVHLASLYEQARYIPGEEPLSAEDLAAARTELSFLAGAKHA